LLYLTTILNCDSVGIEDYLDTICMRLL
jgi:hypothetical protein